MKEDRMVREGSTAAIENLKKEQLRLSGELKGFGESVFGHKGRLDNMERAVADSHDKHAHVLESVKSTHAKLHNDAQGQAAKHARTAERLDQLYREKDDVLSRHSSINERLNYLERLVSESTEGNRKKVEALASAHEAHAKDLQALRRSSQSQTSMAERVDYMEKVYYTSIYYDINMIYYTILQSYPYMP